MLLPLWLEPLHSWPGSAGLRQLTGVHLPSCYEVRLRGCTLRDLFVNFSRPPGSRAEESFVCRLGEIQVRLGARWGVCLLPLVGAAWAAPFLVLQAGGRSLSVLLFCQVVDADSLLAPMRPVRDVAVSQVRWQQPAPALGGRPDQLRLSCTLHWSYLLLQVRCFRVHCWEGTRSASPSREPPGPEKPTFLGLAFANQYRVVDLGVEAPGPGRDGHVEFLVEPVPREGFLVPQAEWGRVALLYSAPP